MHLLQLRLQKCNIDIFLPRHAHKNIDRRLFYDALAVPDEEGSAAVVVAGVAVPVAIGSEAAAVVAVCLSSNLTTFLVRFVTVLFALAVFFAKGFDFFGHLAFAFFCSLASFTHHFICNISPFFL